MLRDGYPGENEVYDYAAEYAEEDAPRELGELAQKTLLDGLDSLIDATYENYDGQNEFIETVRADPLRALTYGVISFVVALGGAIAFAWNRRRWTKKSKKPETAFGKLLGGVEAVNDEVREYTLSVRPLPGATFGAEVFGIDLSEPIQDNTASRLQAWLKEYGVLLFRTQELKQFDTVSVVALFGIPVPPDGQKVPISVYRVKDRDPTPQGTDFWHSDNSYMAEPGGPTALYAVKVPQTTDGIALADTLFADSETAALELPADLWARCRDRQAVHSSSYCGGNGVPEKLADDWKDHEHAHPVLRKNPLTGRESIFVSQGYVREVLGVPPEESTKMLSEIYEHAYQPKYCYTHKWQRGDLLIWDNGRVQHQATTLTLPPGAERIMWRVQTDSVPMGAK